MPRLTRRSALQTAGFGLCALLAGCRGDQAGSDDGTSDDGTDTPTDGGSSDDPTETNTPTDGGSSATPTVTDVERWQLGGTYPVSPRATTGTFEGGFLALLDSRDRLEAFLEAHEFEDEDRETIQEVGRETDFETSLLLYAEAVAPDFCYTELAVEGVAVEGGRLVGTAAAQESDDIQGGCGGSIAYPATLVRVTVEGDTPDSARFTIVDGWGNEVTVDGTATTTTRIDSADLNGHVRPHDDPEPIEALSCPDKKFQRVQPWFDEESLSWGETPADGAPVFALRVDSLTVNRGASVTMTLTNVSDKEQTTGNEHKYSLQVFTKEGWQDLRGHEGNPLPYTDEAVVHEPGEGFEWTFELTREGVVEGHVHEDDLRVCPDLPAGRYRFVFWEPIVGVAFDVE